MNAIKDWGKESECYTCATIIKSACMCAIKKHLKYFGIIYISCIYMDLYMHGSNVAVFVSIILAKLRFCNLAV